MIGAMSWLKVRTPPGRMINEFGLLSERGLNQITTNIPAATIKPIPSSGYLEGGFFLTLDPSCFAMLNGHEHKHDDVRDKGFFGAEPSGA
jgi:hypothetical protein